MEITYRPARAEDLDAVPHLIQQAISDLRLRHGIALPMPLRPTLFQAFCMAEDPDGLWVAEAEGAVIGFGFSWMCGKFWFLSQLFIKPGAQGRGVGQALLSRTLRHAERNGADNRALITFAYNRMSTGLYIRNGMYPREPLYRMDAPAPDIEGRIAHGGHDAVPIASSPDPMEWIGRIDEAVLGFRRTAHHGFLLGGVAARAIRIEHSGQPVGYAYISDGHIGPLAVAPDADAGAVTATAIRCALEARPRQVSVIVPGRADRVLDVVSQLGFRIEEPYVLLSARPFGDWRNYLPANPGYM